MGAHRSYGNAFTDVLVAPLNIDTLRAYWANPAPFHAERDAHYARMADLFAEHDAQVRANQEARWTAEDEAVGEAIVAAMNEGGER